MKKFCLIGLVTLSLLLSACGGGRRIQPSSSFSSEQSSSIISSIDSTSSSSSSSSKTSSSSSSSSSTESSSSSTEESSSSSTDSGSGGEDYTIYQTLFRQIYQLYQDAGGVLSYEDWLEYFISNNIIDFPWTVNVKNYKIVDGHLIVRLTNDVYLDGGILPEEENNNVTVTFYVDGNVYDVQEIRKGEYATQPADPVKTGYEFKGWLGKSGFAWVFSYQVFEDTSLYAKMDAKQYTVTLAPDGGVCEYSSLTATYDQPLTLPKATREGYRFAGWYYLGNQYESGTIYQIDSDITLIALWNDLYTIYFNTNGGEAIQPIGMHSTVIDYLPTPEKENATFLGWKRNGEDFTLPFDNTRCENIELVAAWQEMIDDFYVINNGDGYATILGCADYLTNFAIPETLNNGELIVNKIAPAAFKDKTNLTGISLPYTIDEIGASAFEGCTKLSGFNMGTSTIKDTSAKMGTNVLKGCTELYNLTIPCFNFSLAYLFGNDVDNVPYKMNIGLIYSRDYTLVKDGLFKNISNKEFYVSFIYQWPPIPDNMCKDCECIVGAYSSSSVGKKAFENCHNLAYLTLGNAASVVGDDAFNNCENLLMIMFEYGPILRIIGNGAFNNCPSLDNIFIVGGPERWAEVQIGYNNDSINHATVKIQGEYGLSTYAFPGLDDHELLTFYMDVYGFKYYHSGDPESIVDLQSLVMSFNIISLAYRAFYGNTDIQRVVLPDTVESIGREAFRGCSNLNFINLPSSLTHIYDNAFRSTALTSIDIPDSVTYLGPNAFEGCKDLQEVHLGSGITEITGSDFYGCSSIESMIIPDSVTIIGTNSFEGCTSMQSIVLPESLQLVKSGAFINCPMLRSVFYQGTSDQWNNVEITYSDNNALDVATIYFYSETEPINPGHYWHYVAGVPTAW